MKKNRHKIWVDRPHLFLPDDTIILVARLKETVEYERLREAVGTAACAHEILNCRIRMDHRGRAWYESEGWKTGKCSPSLQSWSFQVAEEDWSVIAEQEINQVRDPFSDRLCRFFAGHREGGTQVVIAAHHLVGDAMSLMYLMEDVIKALSGKTLKPVPVRLLTRKELPKTDRTDAVRSRQMGMLNKIWRQQKNVSGPRECRQTGESYHENYRGSIFCETLDSGTVTVLRHIAREAGISVNGILMAALLQANGGQTDLGLPVNIRANNENFPRSGNFAGGIMISKCYDTAKTLAENGKDLDQEVKNMLQDGKSPYASLKLFAMVEPGLLDSACMYRYGITDHEMAGWFADYLGYAEEPQGICLSNLKSLSFPIEIGPYHLQEVLFLPPVAPNNQKSLGIVTFQGKMQITMHAVGRNTDSPEKRETDAHFFQKFMGYLREPGDSGSTLK